MTLLNASSDSRRVDTLCSPHSSPSTRLTTASAAELTPVKLMDSSDNNRIEAEIGSNRKTSSVKKVNNTAMEDSEEVSRGNYIRFGGHTWTHLCSQHSGVRDRRNTQDPVSKLLPQNFSLK